MNVASRTPEGSPLRCPVCGAVNFLDRSTSSCDAPCASCGTLLWFTDIVVSVFVFPGPADGSSEKVDSFVADVAQAIDESPDPRVLIELHEIEQLDPGCLSILRSLVERCRAKKGLIVLSTGPRQSPDFRISLLRHGHFLVVQSRNEALKLYQQYAGKQSALETNDPNSLTAFYRKLTEGDEDAANMLWQAWYYKLFTYTNKHLEGVSRKMGDVDDIALSALSSFIKSAQLKPSPDFKDRDDLWRLLFAITRRRTIERQRDKHRHQSGGEPESQSHDQEKSGFPDIPAVFSEEFTALFAQSLDDFLNRLNPELRPYAIAKFEGLTNQEIAKKMGVTLRTVERKLHLICRIWSENRDADSA